MRLALIALLLCVGCAPVGPSDSVPDVTNSVSPIPEVTAVLKGHTEDALALASLYDGMADIIEKSGKVETTNHIRHANFIAGTVMFDKRLKGKYPGLGVLAESVVSDAIGMEVKPLDDDTRKKAVEAFRSLSTACREAAK